MQPSGALKYDGNNFDGARAPPCASPYTQQQVRRPACAAGAVLPGRPQRPDGLAGPDEMMRLAVSQPAEPAAGVTRDSRRAQSARGAVNSGSFAV